MGPAKPTLAAEKEVVYVVVNQVVWAEDGQQVTGVRADKDRYRWCGLKIGNS